MPKIELKKRIKKPTIICGFKGFGSVGALVVNQFMKDLQVEEIGGCELREVPPIIALQNGKIFKSVNLFYNKKNNILLVFILAPIRGIEWEIADIIEQLYKKTKAKKIIIPDGIGIRDNDNVFYVSNFGYDKKLSGLGKPLKNSIILGATAALLMKKKLPVICLLGKVGCPRNARIKALTGLPSTIAAAHIINILNKHLKIDINTKDLIKRGKIIEREFENFIKMAEKMGKNQTVRKTENIRYIG